VVESNGAYGCKSVATKVQHDCGLRNLEKDVDYEVQGANLYAGALTKSLFEEFRNHSSDPSTGRAIPVFLLLGKMDRMEFSQFGKTLASIRLSGPKTYEGLPRI